MRKLVIFFLFFLIIISSCKNKNNQYPNEDVFIKYIESRFKIYSSNEYNMLILRDLKTTCVEAHLNYQIDELVVRTIDSLQGKVLYVVSDNPYVHLGLKLILKNKNLIFIKESSVDLIKYGFFLKPTLFHIKGKKIVEWKYM